MPSNLRRIWPVIPQSILLLATGWTVRESNPGGGRFFLHASRPALVTIQRSYTMGTGSFPGVKRPGCDVNHPTPSSAEVKERVELYLYSPLGPSLPVPRGNFTVTFTFNLRRIHTYFRQ